MAPGITPPSQWDAGGQNVLPHPDGAPSQWDAGVRNVPDTPPEGQMSSPFYPPQCRRRLRAVARGEPGLAAGYSWPARPGASQPPSGDGFAARATPVRATTITPSGIFG